MGQAARWESVAQNKKPSALGGPTLPDSLSSRTTLPFGFHLAPEGRLAWASAQLKMCKQFITAATAAPVPLALCRPKLPVCCTLPVNELASPAAQAHGVKLPGGEASSRVLAALLMAVAFIQAAGGVRQRQQVARSRRTRKQWQAMELRIDGSAGSSAQATEKSRSFNPVRTAIDHQPSLRRSGELL